MARTITTTAVFLAVALHSSFALAGVYGDDLSRCLVKSSDADDQATLVQWVFASLALNPAVKPLASITAKQRDTLNRKTAALYQRLLFADCHKESVAALKYEGPATIGAGFNVLGQIAARGLMTDPNTAAGMQAFAAYSDKSKWVKLYKDAGVPLPPSAAGAKAK